MRDRGHGPTPQARSRAHTYAYILRPRAWLTKVDTFFQKSKIHGLQVYKVTTPNVIDLSDKYDAQPRQLLLHNTTARQILFGGAAGGGKSTSGRWDLIYLAVNCPGLQAYIFRRTLTELEANNIRFIRRDLPAPGRLSASEAIFGCR